MKEVAILGATGYTGIELVRLLYGHPHVKVVFLSSDSHAGVPLSRVHPQFAGKVELMLQPLRVEAIPDSVELVFCALPHGGSAGVVPALLERGKRVVDLSADFRLRNAALYRQWYGLEHPAPELLDKAVYGIPELYAAEIKSARLTANPGCYPTSVLLALAPLARRKAVAWDTVIIDAKSGVSGAGRSPRQTFHFPECTENFKAYRVGDHQHIPEMEQELSRLCGGEAVTLTFIPHLVPMVRGILSTIYLAFPRELAPGEAEALYRDFYGEAPFVRVLEQPLLPETRYVRGANYCDIALREDRRTGRLVILCAIDNLVKGAAGQAVQNMNLMLGFPAETGLAAQLPY